MNFVDFIFKTFSLFLFQNDEVRLPQVRPLRHDREGGHVLPSPAKHLQRKDLHHDVGLVHRAGNFVRSQSRLPRLGRLAEVDENEFDHGKLSPLENEAYDWYKENF